MTDVLLHCYKKHKVEILVSPAFCTTCVFQDGFLLDPESQQKGRKKVTKETVTMINGN